MASRTYILAPNFTYKPNGPIQIGSIIADPFHPTKSLSTATSPPPYETVLEHDHELSRETGLSLNLSLWANFLEAIGSSIGTSRSKDITKSFTIEQLETRYLASEPSDNDRELAQRLKEPRVKAALQAGLYGHAPVYLITGVKIARGLTVQTETSRSVGGSIGTSVPVAGAMGVSVGVDIGGEKRRGLKSSFKAGDEDVVFAYQMHVVKLRRRTKENMTVNVFESDAAFLHDEDEEEEETEIEVRLGGVEELKEVAQEMEMNLESKEVVGASNEGVICLWAK
ncbi:hypothetical protein G7Z17_g10965 [Cylindrodendrum hubeiense]|uniref:Uncharacterized protein n=1 Tax=Cylindrodendrum hubeiense TaxID=595255 RepID=A0A9P5H3V9_9HYPO|nr:hypothetical protein G7Z17_g10965 [Cylindrodendrum hubeiense]